MAVAPASPMTHSSLADPPDPRRRRERAQRALVLCAVAVVTLAGVALIVLNYVANTNGCVGPRLHETRARTIRSAVGLHIAQDRGPCATPVELVETGALSVGDPPRTFAQRTAGKAARKTGETAKASDARGRDGAVPAGVFVTHVLRS